MGQAGHALLLDCRSRQTRLVPLADPSVAVLIVDTRVAHALTGGEYAQRRAQCEQAAAALGVASLRDAEMTQLIRSKPTLDPLVFRRAYHVVREIDRTQRAAELLEVGDYEGFGRLMHDSHVTLRDAFEVSCDELDLLVDIAMDIGPRGGVYGSRMTGGGFGGCTVSLVRAEKVESITRRLYTVYLEKAGIEPAVFVTRPSDGARPVGM
jgi:galactokinase